MNLGLSGRCLVVAEAGVNHNGDLGLAKSLVDAAADAGADAVKFQTWQTDKIVAPSAPLAAYQRDNLGDTTDDQRSMLEKLELSQAEFAELAEHAGRRGIVFLSTPDDEESADFLDGLDLPLFKIGSGEVTNLPLLRHVARKGKPVVLSTGMATLEEVGRAVDVLRDAGAPELVLLHCVSLYPAEPEESNLRAMDTLRAAFGLPVGFSDHTLGRDVAVAAVALGACLIEKHLTLSRELEGPDHRASLEPGEFAELVQAVRVVESALGDGRKQPTERELEMRQVVRRRILASRPLGAGTVLAESDLKLRRAAGGLDADVLDQVVGRRLTRDVETDAPLTWDVLG
jgi:N-acetylneuraminate synthase/N,N'-diacetyllegionaminate synthase